MEEKKQSKIIFAVLGVAILLTLTVGLSFAIWSFDRVGGENTITTGTVSMSYTESTNTISIADALPIQNEEAAKVSDDYFEFTVASNTNDTMDVPYEIILTEEQLDEGYTKLSSGYVQVYLTEVKDQVETVVINNTVAELLNTLTSGTIYNGIHKHTTGGSLTTTYRLRLWIPYSVDAKEWNADTKLEYKARIDVKGEM